MFGMIPVVRQISAGVLHAGVIEKAMPEAVIVVRAKLVWAGNEAKVTIPHVVLCNRRPQVILLPMSTEHSLVCVFQTDSDKPTVT